MFGNNMGVYSLAVARAVRTRDVNGEAEARRQLAIAQVSRAITKLEYSGHKMKKKEARFLADRLLEMVK